MFFTKNKKIIANNHDNPYWMSFSDMMSAILIIFILVCMALLFKLSKMEEEVAERIKIVDDANLVRAEILKEIYEELKIRNIHVEISDNHTVLRIPEQTFHFRTNRYDITEELQPTAEHIGKALYHALTKKTTAGEPRLNYLDTVFVEGHTDSRTATGYRKGNWELSALRAISLWEFWIGRPSYGPKLEQLTNLEGKRLFSVSGYAATRRAEEMETSEDAMRKNRRIDIRLTTRQATREELEQTLQPLRREMDRVISPQGEP